MNIEPNSATSNEQRLELLYDLKRNLQQHLSDGNYPAQKVKVNQAPIIKIEHTIKEALYLALNLKLKMKLSNKYKTDLHQVYEQFLAFINDTKIDVLFSELSVQHLESFLSQFNSSGTYYMKKRNDLCILFSLAAKLTNNKSVARDTHTERSKATLHKAYDKKQLRSVLRYLQETSPQLHLCCLLTYGCWLRPHVEVLSLRKRQIKSDCTEIHLSGSENKGGKVRVVYVPPYVKQHLDLFIKDLDQDDNIFTGRAELLNEYYFTTRWKRLRPRLLKDGLIEEKGKPFIHSVIAQLWKSIRKQRTSIYCKR